MRTQVCGGIYYTVSYSFNYTNISWNCKKALFNTHTHKNPNQPFSRFFYKEHGTAGRCAAVNSSHTHEVVFPPIHQHSLSPELKGVSQTPASPLTRKCMNTKQKSCFPNKEFETLPRNKYQMEKHTHENTKLILLSNMTASVSHRSSQCFKASKLRTSNRREDCKKFKRK